MTKPKTLARKLTAALLALLLMLAAAPAGVAAASAEETTELVLQATEPVPQTTEPVVQADPWPPSSYTTMSVGGSYNASISPAGTVRYFRFTAPSSGTYVFTSSGSADSYGYLYNASGTQLAYNDDNGSDRNFRISYSLTSGSVYYLKARLYSSSATGSFTVRVTGQDTWPPSSYTTMATGTSYGASITSGGMVKYFRFVPSASGTYTFSSTGSCDTYGYLLNSSGSTLAYNDDGGAGVNFQISYSLTAGTTYYLKVRMYSSSVTGSFTVSVTSPWPPSYTTMTANTNYTANITVAGDAKYFRFTPTVSGTHVFISTGSADPYGYLLNSSGTTLASNDDYNGRNFQISYNLTAGTVYYLKARHYGSTTTGSFNVSVMAPGSAWPPSSYTTMNLGSSYNASITTGGDARYFRFTPSASGTYYFASTGSSDTYGYLYNASGSLLASNDDYGGYNFRIGYNLISGTTYYLKVRLYSSSATGSFSVSVTTPSLTVSFNAMGGAVSPASKSITPGSAYGTLPTPTPAAGSGLSFLGWYTDSSGGQLVTASSTVSAYAANHTLFARWNWPPASYTTMSAGSSYTASISPAGKVLYYRFTPSTSGTYNFTSTGSLDPIGYLLNASGAQLAYNDDYSGYNFRISYNLTAGTTYYLKARLYSSSATGSFTVSVAGGGTSTYTVSYNANGGSGAPGSQTKTHGTTLYLSSTRPTLSGRTFLGWATSSNATSAQYQPGGAYTTNASVTLYAVWSSATPTTLLLSQSEIYSFTNSSSNFRARYYMLDRDFNKLANYARSYYGYDNYRSVLQTKRNSTWNGSCYGMAMTAILNKKGMINYRNFCAHGAASAGLWGVCKPVNCTGAESMINYYQISQYLPYLDAKSSTGLAYTTRTSSGYSAGLQKLVNEAKAGKLIEFNFFITGWGGHAIVIVGYRQNANGSHDLIAWNNWYTDFRSIVNVSSDYKTCKVEGDTVDAIEFYTDFTDINRIDIDGPSNVLSIATQDMADTTQITLPIGAAISITNEAGETLFYDPETGDAMGDIEILSQHLIVNSTPEGPAPAELAIEIPNSDAFIFNTDGDNGIDVSVVNSGIFAAASSERADTVVISNTEGVFVIGEGVMDYEVSLGVNSALCDTVTMTGSANSGASLEFKDGDVVAGGAFGTTVMTVYSSEGEDIVVEEIEFEALANSILVTSAVDGSIDLMIDSTNTGTFDTSITDTPETADKTALAAGMAGAKAIEQGNYTDGSFKSLTDAIDAAQAIASKNDAAQSEVNAAAAAISTAVSGLTENPPPDKTGLNSAITQAKAIAKGNYTDASYQALQNAIAAAETVAADPAATQQQVTDMTTALNSAVSGLTENPPDKTGLNSAITQAKAIAKGNYTDASYQALQNAIAAAETVAANSAATQAQITATTTALNSAISDLKTINKPVANGSTSVTLDYVGSMQLSVTGENITWSGGNQSVSVDQNGKITSLKNFSKTGSATIRATNSAGFVEFNVRVQPTFMQWIMIIILFGWLWM